MTIPAETESIDQMASDWMAKVRSGEMTREDHDALSAWLKADSRHGSRLAHYEGLWLSLDAIKNHPQVLAMREEQTKAPMRGRRALAAGLSALLVLGIATATWFNGFGPWHRPSSSPSVTSRISTGLGQVTRVALQDGSILTLDTDSSVETEFTPGQRRIRLLRGRALFRVAHDRSRPFTVSTDRMAVTATGTEFVVDVEPGKQVVRMVEGSVVARPVGNDLGFRMPLTAGRSLSVEASGKWNVSTVDGTNDLDWVTGTLTFRNARLADVVEQTNRYSAKKIVIADQATADQRLNAILKAGDVDTLLASVDALGLARVKTSAGNRIVLAGK